jgi:signal transduction histidine kinase
MKIRSQLLIVFILIVLIGSAVKIFAYLNIVTIIEGFNHLNERIIPETDLLKDFQINSERFSSLTLSYTLGGFDELLKSKIKDDLKNVKAEFNKTNNEYSDIVSNNFSNETETKEDIETRDDINQKWYALVLLSDKIIQEIDNLDENYIQKAEEVAPQIINSIPPLPPFSSPFSSNELSNDTKSSITFNTFFNAHESLSSTLEKSLVHEMVESEEVKGQVELTFAETAQTIIAYVIVSMIIAIVIAILVSEKISRPIMELEKATRELLSGNYTYPIRRHSLASDEIVELSEQFDKMRDSIKANEKLTIRGHQLEKANVDLIRIERAKEEFISMVSHELKTPLGPAKGYLEMLLRPKMGGKLSDKQAKYIGIIYRNILKLETLVGDVLDVYKLDMGRLNFSKSNTEVQSLINSVMLDLKPLAIENNIELQSEIRVDKGTTIFCDSKRIEQVFSNLIKNSIDFVSENIGKIMIKTRESIDNESVIYFQVEDNGIGISSDKVDNLFQKFYQIDTTATRKHGGTGLGLVICKGIIEAHGGKIWIDKSYTNGLRIIFTLPKVDQSKEQESNL